MVVEICLAIIATTMVVTCIVLVRLSIEAQKTIREARIDLRRISMDTSRLSMSLHEFVQSDLCTISQEVQSLIGKIDLLASDINNKSRSLNVFFRPLESLSSRLTVSSSSSNQASSKAEVAPKVMKYLAAGALFIQITRRFLRKYG